MTTIPAFAVADRLPSSAAWAMLTGRGTLLATGPAAVAFVDKFTTAAIATLVPGTACEGFFADVRGWVLAFAAILRTDDGLLIDCCDAAAAARLGDHLEHHHIREAVEIHDTSASLACVAIIGPSATAWLASHSSGPMPAAAFHHTRITLGPVEVQTLAIDWFDDAAYLLRLPAGDATTLTAWLAAEGLAEAAPDVFETLRIEHRLPCSRDLVDKTLPQELDRTARAISFTKGCYLGQETVARIDALGHVNRTLVVVATDGDAPPPIGAAVTVDGEPAGIITSACLSPRLGPCGLAIVHRRGLAPGAAVAIAGRAARVAVAPNVGTRK